jgi:major membrane immunogen (membrane-anchored lipoprotein)
LTVQIQLRNPFESNLQDIDFQKKIRKWNNKLQDKKIQRICSDYPNETGYLWNSDPDRKGKDVYDSGEVHELNEQYEMDAVRRDIKKNALVRVRTGNQVYWSHIEGKWVDNKI